MAGVAQARQHFLTFEGTATDRQLILIKHSTYIHACCHQRYSLDRDRMHIFAVYGCRRSGIDNEVFPYRVLRKVVCVLSNEVNPFLPILFDLV